MKYFLRSINLLNLILLAALIAAITFIVLPFAGMEAKISLPAAGQASVQEEVKKSDHQSAAPSGDYGLIADQNLFSPERKMPSEKAAEKEKPLPKPEFVLYGTVMTDDVSLAYLDDRKSPITTPGRGRRVRVLKKGDSLSGYTLKDIEADRVVMGRGDETITVYLLNPKDKERGSEEKAKTPPAVAAPRR